MKKKTYILGDGLKLGNQILRKKEYEELNKLGTLDIYNPWMNEEINDKTKEPTAEEIFRQDTERILEAEIIVADADNDSVGSSVEIGQIWGVNYMLDRLEDALLNSNSDEEFGKAVRGIMREIPKKQLFWQCTDVRNVPGLTETGLRRSYSLNQYLYGCLLATGGEERKFEDILEELKQLDK